MHANNEIANLLPLEQVGELVEYTRLIFILYVKPWLTHGCNKSGIHFLALLHINFTDQGWIYLCFSDVKSNPLYMGGPGEKMRGGT